MQRLEEWHLTQLPPSDPYKAPELGRFAICGKVFGHALYDDGDPITTSTPVRIDPDTMIMETKSGSKYQLGVIDPDYESLYPNAFNRLVESLSKSN